MLRIVAAALLALVCSTAPLASAHETREEVTDHGAITIEVVEGCTVHVTVEGVDHDTGGFVVQTRFGEDDNNPPHHIANGTWEADAEGSVDLGEFTADFSAGIEVVLVMGEFNDTTGTWPHVQVSDLVPLDCDETEIPFFPTVGALAIGALAVLGTVAFVVMRRR